MIRPYLRDITNDNKTQGEWKVRSGNAAIDYKTQGEWKIQLSITINFISSREYGDFYCLNCFHSYPTKNKLEKDYNICKNHGYCYVEMPKEDNKNIKILS